MGEMGKKGGEGLRNLYLYLVIGLPIAVWPIWVGVAIILELSGVEPDAEVERLASWIVGIPVVALWVPALLAVMFTGRNERDGWGS